jgi:hypothetical protein
VVVAEGRPGGERVSPRSVPAMFVNRTWIQRHRLNKNCVLVWVFCAADVGGFAVGVRPDFGCPA